VEIQNPTAKPTLTFRGGEPERELRVTKVKEAQQVLLTRADC